MKPLLVFKTDQILSDSERNSISSAMDALAEKVGGIVAICDGGSDIAVQTDELVVLMREMVSLQREVLEKLDNPELKVHR